MLNEKVVCICMGLVMGIFSIPLYRWLLGEFSIIPAILIGLVMASILYRHSAFGLHGGEGLSGRRQRRRPQNRERNHGRIHVDEYGRIFDPDDE